MILIDAIELKKKSFRYETNCGQKFLKTVLVKDIDNATTVDAVTREEYERVRKERDAAISDLESICDCTICKYYHGSSVCEDCMDYNKWEWRGVGVNGTN